MVLNYFGYKAALPEEWFAWFTSLAGAQWLDGGPCYFVGQSAAEAIGKAILWLSAQAGKSPELSLGEVTKPPASYAAMRGSAA